MQTRNRGQGRFSRPGGAGSASIGARFGIIQLWRFQNTSIYIYMYMYTYMSILMYVYIYMHIHFYTRMHLDISVDRQIDRYG